jgi:hypothetical protein
MGPYRSFHSNARHRGKQLETQHLIYGAVMIVVYLLASLLGAFATGAALWPVGWLLALACAPLGGSALAFLVAVGIALARTGGQVHSRPGAVPSHI